MNAIIRPAQPEDAAGIAAVQVASWRTTYCGIVPDGYLDGMSVEVGATRWVANLATAGALNYIAEDESGIIGFASGGRLREPVGEYDAELWAIYLLQEKQGGGIGRRLVQTLADALLAAGYRSMIVWVLQDNSAVNFYKRMGATAVTGKMIEIGGVALPDLALGWKDLSEIGRG
jgi:GNAT superfamily N-acetyltransferase